jgi:hypothetical protein
MFEYEEDGTDYYRYYEACHDSLASEGFLKLYSLLQVDISLIHILMCALYVVIYAIKNSALLHYQHGEIFE